MRPELGEVLEGKVTGITKFGAFVTLPDGSSGLVHISEIADAYVTEVRDYLEMGQQVKVKVIGFGDGGKINLSIKKAQPRPAARSNPGRSSQGGAPRSAPAPRRYASQEPRGQVYETSGNASFEDKLKHFMQESDSRMSGNKLYEQRRSRRRGGAK